MFLRELFDGISFSQIILKLEAKWNAHNFIKITYEEHLSQSEWSDFLQGNDIW